MRGGRKPAVKKNLFESDEQEENKPKQQTREQKTKDQKMVDRVNQMYDAAKIQQNQLYIGRQKVQQELSKQKKKQLQAKKTKKKVIKNKNLFQSDQEQNKEDQQIQKKQSDKEDQKQQQVQKKEPQKIKAIRNLNKQFSKEQAPKNNGKSTPTKKIQQKQQKQENKSDEEQRSQSNSQEEQKIQKKRQQNIKKMVQSQSKITTNGSKLRQISFSKLVEEAGTDKQELKTIVYEAIPKGYRAVCLFRRIQSGFVQTYELKLQDNQRALFYCQNQRGSIGANYYISLTKEMDKKSSSYLGKLRGNSTGSVYQLYDNGKQPQNNINRREWRSSMARIQYQSNFMGMNGPRKLRVILPNAKSMQDYDSYKLAQNQDLSTFQPPLIVKYKNKQPKWNERLKSYALNFGGRVKQASIKNFILVQDLGNAEEEYNATNNLVFGKIDDHSFSLEAVYPLSIYQAFAIVMSQFDFKLSCQ